MSRTFLRYRRAHRATVLHRRSAALIAQAQLLPPGTAAKRIAMEHAAELLCWGDYHHWRAGGDSACAREFLREALWHRRQAREMARGEVVHV